LLEQHNLTGWIAAILWQCRGDMRTYTFHMSKAGIAVTATFWRFLW